MLLKQESQSAESYFCLLPKRLFLEAASILNAVGWNLSFSGSCVVLNEITNQPVAYLE